MILKVKKWPICALNISQTDGRCNRLSRALGDQFFVFFLFHLSPAFIFLYLARIIDISRLHTLHHIVVCVFYVLFHNKLLSAVLVCILWRRWWSTMVVWAFRYLRRLAPDSGYWSHQNLIYLWATFQLIGNLPQTFLLYFPVCEAEPDLSKCTRSLLLVESPAGEKRKKAHQPKFFLRNKATCAGCYNKLYWTADLKWKIYKKISRIPRTVEIEKVYIPAYHLE